MASGSDYKLVCMWVYNYQWAQQMAQQLVLLMESKLEVD